MSDRVTITLTREQADMLPSVLWAMLEFVSDIGQFEEGPEIPIDSSQYDALDALALTIHKQKGGAA